MVNFSSDNVAGVHPKIMEALMRANEGRQPSYGADEFTQRLQDRVSEVFERSCAVFPVATGTAANALALSHLSPPYGVIYCHEASHIQVDECGAPEFYSGGAKLMALSGERAKMTPDALEAAIFGAGAVHHAQPAVLSLTQSTELGGAYSLAEIKALTEIAQKNDLRVHMDGARFANALVSLGCSPAEMTWKAGVDVLCLGATKNGAMAAEAVIFFDEALAGNFRFRRKRGGHLFSKMRFLSAQLEAYLEDDLWLQNARHANAMAARLAAGLAEIPGARFLGEGQDNEIFVYLPKELVRNLRQEGYRFEDWDAAGPGFVRLLTSFNASVEEVDGFLQAARRLAGQAA